METVPLAGVKKNAARLGQTIVFVDRPPRPGPRPTPFVRATLSARYDLMISLIRSR